MVFLNELIQIFVFKWNCFYLMRDTRGRTLLTVTGPWETILLFDLGEHTEHDSSEQLVTERVLGEVDFGRGERGDLRELLGRIVTF